MLVYSISLESFFIRGLVNTPISRGLKLQLAYLQYRTINISITFGSEEGNYEMMKIIIRICREIKHVISFRMGLDVTVIENTPPRDYLCDSIERERLEFLHFFPGSGN